MFDVDFKRTSLDISRRHLSWFLFFRLMVTTLFLGGTIFYQWRSVSVVQPQIPFFYILIVLTYLQTIISALILPKTTKLNQFVFFQVVWDLLLASFVIYLTGAFDSQFSFLYILIIFSASLFLPRRDVILTASAASILYGSLLDLQYFGYLPTLGRYIPPTVNAAGSVLYAVFLNVSAFIMVAMLSAQLGARLRTSQQQLKRKEIDLEELANLNQTILANINSGLMLINRKGRIRSFNEAASRITGYSFSEIYDSDVQDIFPGFDIYSNGEFNVISRGQGVFKDRSKEQRTLGFATSLVRDSDSKVIGLLVVFQDLTELLEMEDQLRRSDRLAAVGRLASGMAHEIRNPLASISGSVQLLMENKNLSDEDRRLMSIVVREADRLSTLLTDFLTFAKPAKPDMSEFDISAMLDELTQMLESDRRFSKIDIIKEYQSERMVYADQNLLHQVVWDLAINASEAMSGEGQLVFGISNELPMIYLEDTGPGIPESMRGKIFEPFFTTKDSGTGLGLATVYTIIEAHGGQIEVTPGEQSGTRFTITLPSRDSQSFAVFAEESQA